MAKKVVTKKAVSKKAAPKKTALPKEISNLKLKSGLLLKPYKSPAINGLEQNEEMIRSQDLKGRWVVLYFYPKDMTPGCTVEANDFQKKLRKFNDNGCVVVGVSRDSCKSHAKFADKEGLSLTLISDEDEKLCKAFDVIREKSLYGRKYMGVDRSTFLISPDGKVVAEWRGVKVPGHVDQVLSTLLLLA